MSEIVNTRPLCWVIDFEWNKFFKECTLESLQQARAKKIDIRVWDSIFFDSEWKEYKNPWSEILTHSQVTKYWSADIADRFVYFALPKYPKKIQSRLKISLQNMPREQRKNLSYEAIKIAIDRWIHEDSYYS